MLERCSYNSELISLQEQDELYHHCSRYIRCNANNCPLDSHYPRYVDLNDRQKECKLTEKEIAAIKNNVS